MKNDHVRGAAVILADAIRAYAGWPPRGKTCYKKPTKAQIASKARVDREFETMIDRHLRAVVDYSVAEAARGSFQP